MKLIEIRNLLRKNLFLVTLRLYSRGENPKNYIVSKGTTEICIDGYPRSANSFSVRMFKLGNPNVNIAHHTHSIGNLKKAIENGIPSVALIRDPEYAIVSSVIAHKKDNIEDEIYRYISIYRWVESNLDNLVIADFDCVINNFNVIINNINNRFNKSFSLIDDVCDADTQVKNDIEKRYDKLGQSKMSHIKPVPTKGRDQEKERLRDSVLKNSDFQEAKKLYNNIMQGLNS